MSPQRILVTMATGNQGSALIRALARRNETSSETATALPWSIIAATRDVNSLRAQALAKLPGVTMLQSEYEPEQLIKKAASIGQLHGIFSVQSMYSLPSHVPKGATGETVLGKQVAEVALAYGIKHLVYSSVDAGGLPRTDIPHFESKRLIEEHIETLPFSYRTILRPSAFMDNYGFGGFMDRMMNTTFRKHLHGKVKLIAASDIGEFAAMAFEDPVKYNGVRIALAGDDLTADEIFKVVEAVKGRPLPTTLSFFTMLLLWTNGEMRTMFRFFNEKGFEADVQALRKIHPGLKTFRQYVEAEM